VATGRKVYLPTHALFQLIRQYELPSLSQVETRNLTARPVVLEVLVGTDGRICALAVVGKADPVLSAAIEVAIRGWKFRPPAREGRRLCVASRVFVYARKLPQGVVAVVPELNDQSNKSQ
jgi:hypothetical protein